ncbi:uncharacterized protein [Battus philenor]|uniref:uncharacterized protein n=1 Tax=Battus philenor TaxID=42288 RepID=UPI0035D08F82
MSNIEMHCKLLLYLDKRRFLEEIKNSCDSFLALCSYKTNNKFPPLRQLLELDVMDLLNIFPKLGDFLLREPLQFQQICNEILYACMISIDSDNTQNILAMQAAVTVRLKCFPPLLSYRRQSHYDRIMCFNGLLLDITKSDSYVYHTVWSCPEECVGNEVILHFIPKTPPKCYVCRSILFENSGLRRCGEKVIATFLSNCDLFSKKYIIVDDLISKLKIGSIYNVLYVVLKTTKTVWSLEEIVSLPAPLTFPSPEDVSALFEVCEGVSWKFIYCLASSIGVRVAPLHCFMQVKIFLLLSLVSVKANYILGSPIIHVLVTGHESRYVGELMSSAAMFADRSIGLGNSNSSVKLSLIGSSGGVCVLTSPLYLYNQKQISEIVKILENGDISTDNGDIKIKCAIWATCVESKKINIGNLSSIFGTVCRGDFGEHYDDLSNFMLDSSVNPIKKSKDEVNAMNDVMAYINLISGINVHLDKSAESLLKSYFIASRKERPKVTTTGSIAALVTISLTSARLCRRTVAIIDDAIFAIWLHVCGSPDPRFAPEEYLHTPSSLHKLQENMSNFKQWLEQFTGCYIS